jgi:CheY-like chemotaxis protein
MTDYTHPILIIEDNPVDLDLAKRAFQKSDILNPIQTARDGMELLAYIERWLNGEELPAIILLDLKLPKLNGLEVLKIIKQETICNNVPVIVLTSSSDLGDIRTAYECGANSYLIKPIGYDQFLELIFLINQYWIKSNIYPW